MPEEQGQVDTATALTALTMFQGYVQQADAKVGTLVVVNAGSAFAVMAAQAESAGQRGSLASLLLVVFTIAFLASGYHLVQALRPRRTPAPQSSRFSIAMDRYQNGEIPPYDKAETNAVDEVREAWELSRVFATLARLKHAHVARSIPYTSVMLVAALGSVVVESLL
ncbi:hypothetical protein [Salinactinospora qingdaonensis]|uniref:Pycsar effector protein domain-containing protein n=1 Tax=Salinactinospora qingdaonensis TaxID=702744 RepID=A0ABP7FWL9_9ACTN